VVGVLGDFSGQPDQPLPPFKARRFVNISRDNFERVLAGMRPRLAIKVDNKLTNDDTKLAIELPFKSMDDFEPDNLVNQIEPLRRLLELRGRLACLLSKLECDELPPGVAQTALSDLVRQSLPDEGLDPEALEAAVKARVAEVDRILSAQLSEVLHAPEFQRLEACWRGLHYLVFQSETSPLLSIRVLNVSKKDLSRDLEKASEFDRSALFRKVYTEEFDTFGGTPYGALIGDYEFSDHPVDIALLERISSVAAAAHALFISSASPRLFGWDSFTDSLRVRRIDRIFDRTEYVKWRSFRKSEDARYVGLCLPHILLRPTYGRDTVPAQTFNFEEHVEGPDGLGADRNKHLWGNAAYAFGSRLTETFARHHWCAAIGVPEGGGRVQGLPTYAVRTEEGEVFECPTEVVINPGRAFEFSKLGCIPLTHYRGTGRTTFLSTPSCQTSRVPYHDGVSANVRCCLHLVQVFAASRFAHYLKVMMQYWIGSFSSSQDCEDFLNRWITDYILNDDDASSYAKATYPLREAHFEVAEVPGMSGTYEAELSLKPHCQLDVPTDSLRLVFRRPP
jgi:type VI secretion system protein ImpC